MKMMKRIAIFLPAILMISLPLATAARKSDGYYGRRSSGDKRFKERVD